MAIYEPDIHFSKNDKKLLLLLSNFLLEKIEGNEKSNLSKNFIALSDSEAKELTSLLEKLINTKEFIETSYFIEIMSSMGLATEKNAREIYLSARKRRGRSRAMASHHWAKYLSRLGIKFKHPPHYQQNPLKPNLYDVHPEEMLSPDQFYKMEKRLFEKAGIHPKVINVLLMLLEKKAENIIVYRKPLGLEKGSLKKIYTTLLKEIRARNAISKVNTCAALTLVANMSVLFTTRDWNAIGTISCMGGAAASLYNPKK